MSDKSMVFKNRNVWFYDLFTKYGGIAVFTIILHPGDVEVAL
jgi:hypothetical protein